MPSSTQIVRMAQERMCVLCFRLHKFSTIANDKEVTMINLAKQGFVNPFLSGIGASFQPGAVGSVGRCPCCGNAVTVASTQQLGVNPVGFGATLGQQMGGFSPNPY